MTGPRRRLAVALLIAALFAMPAPAAARALNPCSFADFDTPCKVKDGAYRALTPEGGAPYPVVVYLYGSLGLADLIARNRLFQRALVDRGYVLLVPEALEVNYRGGVKGTGWGRRGRRNHPRDDLDFLRQVLLDAERQLSIDRDRVLFMGQSDGGYMIWEIACHAPDLGAAFAVHAASYGGPLPRRCRRPVRFLQTHGREDEVVPFDGPRRYKGRLISAPISKAMEVLARTNGCDGDPEPVGNYYEFKRIGWEGCAENAALDFLVHEGGHSWPRSWIPAVLDWFEDSLFKPAVRAVRRVGDGASGAGFRGIRQGGSGFKRAPRTDGDDTGRGGFRAAPTD